MNNKAYELMSWPAFYSIVKEAFGISFRSVKDVVEYSSDSDHDKKWYLLRGWEHMEDLDILAHLSNLKAIVGKIYIVTEVSYKAGLGPFGLDGSCLTKFVNNHLTEFGECFFNGDVIIVSKNDKLMWVFHHEGSYALIKGGT